MLTMITQAYLRSILDYNSELGVFRWRRRADRSEAWNARFAGNVAGSKIPKGYWILRIDNRSHYAHRMAFLYMTGKLPSADVDHVNGDRSDNRWANLRAATRAENLTNSVAHKNRSGLKGVSHNHGKWMATIWLGGKQEYLGTYDTPEKAHAVYREASEREHGEFSFTRR